MPDIRADAVSFKLAMNMNISFFHLSYTSLIQQQQQQQQQKQQQQQPHYVSTKEYSS